MADPLTIIGTAGAVANIIDVIGKTTGAIRELRNEWKEADITCLSLVTQLTALQAAFTKIKEWTDAEPTDLNYQLVMDLDVIISCCRVLTGKLDVRLSELHQTANEKLDFSSKVKLVFGSKSMDDLQKLIGRSTNALTLLLTACSCKSTSEQKSLLEKSSTRKALRQVENDSASLIVHRDTDSLISRMTDHNPEAKRSHAINRLIEGDSRRLRSERKILLLGDSDGKSDFMKAMKMNFQSKYSADELEAYRLTIYKDVIDSAKALITAMNHFGIQPQQERNQAYCEFLLDYSIEPDFKQSLEAKVGEAISSVWQDSCIPRILEHSNELYILESAAYFIKEINRIASPDYVPHEADILRTRVKSTGISELRISTAQLSMNFLDIGSQMSERKRWIHCFENVVAILFIVDLGSYDQVLLEDSSQNRMIESLALYGAAVNSRWFMRTSVLLLLCNVGRLKQKLARSPLTNHFPDYSGGNDVNRAAKYILWRFNQVNRAHLDIYPHLVEFTDHSRIQPIVAAIKETIFETILGNTGFL